MHLHVPLIQSGNHTLAHVSHEGLKGCFMSAAATDSKKPAKVTVTTKRGRPKGTTTSIQAQTKTSGSNAERESEASHLPSPFEIDYHPKYVHASINEVAGLSPPFLFLFASCGCMLTRVYFSIKLQPSSKMQTRMQDSVTCSHLLNLPRCDHHHSLPNC